MITPLREFNNRAGTVYNAERTETIFAEDMNLIGQNLLDLQEQLNDVLTGNIIPNGIVFGLNANTLQTSDNLTFNGSVLSLKGTGKTLSLFNGNFGDTTGNSITWGSNYNFPALILNDFGPSSVIAWGLKVGQMLFTMPSNISFSVNESGSFGGANSSNARFKVDIPNTRINMNYKTAFTDTGTSFAPSALIHGISTSEQFRLGYDALNYLSLVIGSTGNATFSLNGLSSKFIFSNPLEAQSLKATSTGGFISSDGSAGATGTFTTLDAQTVTVKDGIITDISSI